MRVIHRLHRNLAPFGGALSFALIALGAHAQGGSLQKTVVTIDGNGDGAFEVAETVQYTLVFTNIGSTDLTNVVVRDASSGCISLDTGSVVVEPTGAATSSSSGSDVQVDFASPLAPAASVTITFVGTSTDIGTCCNQATWTSVEVPSGVSDRDTTDATPDQPTCHAAVSSTGPDTDAIIDKQVLSAGCLAPGNTVVFRIRIQNTGRHPIRNVAMRDVLDTGFENVVVLSGLGFDPATNTVFLDSGTWGVGEEDFYTYSATVPCTIRGALANTATLTFEDNGGTVFTRSDTESVAWGRPDLAASTKRWHDDPTDGDTLVSAGEKVTFTITIRNTGECEALNVAVSDPLDARFVGTAPTLVVDSGGSYDMATGTIVWTVATTPELAAIQPGGSVTLTFTTEVEPGTAEGQLIPNTVTLDVLGNDTSACPALPSFTWTVALLSGGVVYGSGTVTDTLLRNDFVACLRDAYRTVRGGYPTSTLVAVLRERPTPQSCSTPSAINPRHPQTDAIVNPTSPHVFAGDALAGGARCPQLLLGSGRVLTFYELQTNCTETLRVAKSTVRPADVVITW